MSRLAELLKELGQKADVYKAYIDNPEAVMKDYDLNQDEVRAMLDKDLEAVKRMSGLENLKTNSTISAHD